MRTAPAPRLSTAGTHAAFLFTRCALAGLCGALLAGCAGTSPHALPTARDGVAVPAPAAAAPRATPAPAPAAGEASAQATPQPRSDCSVVLYGDSILHGGYAGSLRLSEPPAQTLRRVRPRYAVEDLTANGETATQRLGTFGQEHRDARFLVIAHGINDVAQRLDLDSALRRMVRVAQQEGREVILTGLSRQPVSVPGRAQGDAVIRRVASDMHVAFADWGSVPYQSSEMADVLHPAKPYSDRLVQRIADVLDRLAPECAQPATGVLQVKTSTRSTP